MNRVTAFLIAVLAAGSVLAAVALGTVERRGKERSEELAASVRESAATLAQRLRAELQQKVEIARAIIQVCLAGSSVLEANADGCAAYLGRDGIMSYVGRATPTAQSSSMVLSERDQRLFGLSIHGGEALEFASREPGRAVVAYTFFIDRIASPDLRARLHLRAARAALKSSRVDLASGFLTSELLENVAVREGELPIALLAHMLQLEAASTEGRAATEAALEQWLARHHAVLTTAAFEVAIERLHAPAPRLFRHVGHRRRLESAVAIVAGTGRSLVPHEIRLVGDTLLVTAAPVTGGDLPLAAVEWKPAAPSLGSLVTRFIFAARPEDFRTDELVLPVSTADGTPLFWLAARDHQLANRRAQVSRVLWLERGQVALLVVLLAAAGCALLAAARRSWRLADLRARLLANVSHELKTPLASLRVLSELLANDSMDDARRRRYGELAHNECLRLNNLIESLLEHAFGEHNGAALEGAPVALDELLCELAKTLAVRAEHDGVAFRCTVAAVTRPALGYCITTHAASVERVVLNLIDNALKYRCAQRPFIELELAATGESELSIAVRDNGVGIDPLQQGRIFEDFFRARFEDYAVKGLGLGLSIARRIATRIGGRLSFESALGRGSVFTLSLPREWPSQPRTRPRKTRAAL